MLAWPVGLYKAICDGSCLIVICRFGPLSFWWCSLWAGSLVWKWADSCLSWWAVWCGGWCDLVCGIWGGRNRNENRPKKRLIQATRDKAAQAGHAASCLCAAGLRVNPPAVLLRLAAVWCLFGFWCLPNKPPKMGTNCPRPPAWSLRADRGYSLHSEGFLIFPKR